MEENSSQPLAVGELSPEIKEQLKCREDLCKAMREIPVMAPEPFRAEIARIRRAYEESPQVPPEFAELLGRKFAEAAAAAEARAQEMDARQAALSGLEVELKKILDAGELVVKSDLEKFDAACIARLGEIPEEFAAKTAPIKAKLAEEEALAAADAARAEAFIEELKTLTAGDDVNALRQRKSEIDAAVRELAHLPRPVKNRLEEARHKASQKISQFFEELDFARWESYTLKQDICAKIEEMNNAETPDFPKFAKTLQELREQWKALGPVPKVKNEEINSRFLEASRQLQRKVDEFFSNRRQEQKQAAADKQELVAQAEHLSSSTEWNVTAAAFKELQAKWKALPRAGAAEKELFAKFRAAADAFFNARSAYFAERDKKFAAVIERKEALIAEAEALQQGDFRRARQLREDFRAAGSAGKAEPALYERLKAALDKFFDGRRAAFAEKENESRTLIAELEQLSADPVNNLSRSREIREKLRELDCRNTAEEARKAAAKFDAALAETRKQENRAKGDMGREAARAVAEALDRVLAGEKFEFTPPATAEMFPKLAGTAKLIAAVLADEPKALEKLNRQVASARQERERICAELEKLAGKPAEEEENLAAALQAAIMGNFAREEAREAAKAIDPDKLASEFLNAGAVPSAELEASFLRFDAAMSKL
ncbi:MAG: DUF349 domain-containing protein [Lentisphaeria bacterium]|nr:DUF349 domain-containing protein [Lentisphaeria bacterium]